MAPLPTYEPAKAKELGGQQLGRWIEEMADRLQPGTSQPRINRTAARRPWETFAGPQNLGRHNHGPIPDHTVESTRLSASTITMDRDRDGSLGMSGMAAPRIPEDSCSHAFLVGPSLGR